VQMNMPFRMGNSLQQRAFGIEIYQIHIKIQSIEFESRKLESLTFAEYVENEKSSRSRHFPDKN